MKNEIKQLQTKIDLMTNLLEQSRNKQIMLRKEETKTKQLIMEKNEVSYNLVGKLGAIRVKNRDIMNEEISVELSIGNGAY